MGSVPESEPIEQFARDLLALRGSTLGIRELAAATGLPVHIVEEATSGRSLPSLSVALAYAEACGGARAEWTDKWQRAADEVVSVGSTPAPNPRGPRAGQSKHRPLIITTVAGVGAIATLAAILIAWPTDSPHSTPVHGADSPTSEPRSLSSRYFEAQDPMNVRHPPADEAPESDAMIEDLLSGGSAKLYARDAGLPVYHATPRTPTYSVTPRKQTEWENPFSGNSLPWNASWRVTRDLARLWSVVVTPDRRSIECKELRVQQGRPSCDWGAVTDLTKSSTSLEGAPTGSGLSRLAGVITRQDWDLGRINHALTFGRPDNAEKYVYPAVRSDGSGTGRWHLGQYIWLDASYDIDSDSSLKPYERLVAHALQDYGAYNVKNVDRDFSFTSEYGVSPPGAGSDNFPSLSNIPFSKYLHIGTVHRPAHGAVRP